MYYVYQFELKHKKELESILTKDPYGEQSFARLGYILKESNAVGLKGGYIVLCFKTSDDATAKLLLEQIKSVLTCTELNDADKDKVVNIIETEENSATAGFGSIFS